MASKDKLDRKSFVALLADVKLRIQNAQTRAMLAVNDELTRLYWDIGRMIDVRQKREGWGSGVIPRLALELKNELPELKGFSERNIGLMIAFARAYPEPGAILQQAVAKLDAPPISPQAVAKLASAIKAPQTVETLPDSLLWLIPWGHHAVLLAKIKALATRRWYMEQTLANGWSRNILTMQIESQAHARHGKARSNFALTLPEHQSDLVQQMLKDPYIFYCNVVNDRLKQSADNPTIGLILCQERSRLLAEYSFAGIDKPIGISTYELTRALPKDLRSALPTVEEIEAELSEVAKQAMAKPTDGKRGGTVREPRARYGSETIRIVDQPFDATDGTDTPFGQRWGGDVAQLTPAHLAALADGKTLALDVQNEYVLLVQSTSHPPPRPAPPTRQAGGPLPSYAPSLPSLPKGEKQGEGEKKRPASRKGGRDAG